MTTKPAAMKNFEQEKNLLSAQSLPQAATLLTENRF